MGKLRFGVKRKVYVVATMTVMAIKECGERVGEWSEKGGRKEGRIGIGGCILAVKKSFALNCVS